MAFSWETILAGAIGGISTTVVAKMLEALNKYRDRKYSNKVTMDSHLDPIIKSGDELLGKLHSLAKEDFKTADTSCA